MVQRFDDIVAVCRHEERLVKLREVLEGDGDVELAEVGRAETELAPPDRVTLQLSLALQVIEVVADSLDEFQVVRARCEVDPNLVMVHAFDDTLEAA